MLVKTGKIRDRGQEKREVDQSLDGGPNCVESEREQVEKRQKYGHKAKVRVYIKEYNREYRPKIKLGNGTAKDDDKEEEEDFQIFLNIIYLDTFFNFLRSLQFNSRSKKTQEAPNNVQFL